MTKRTKKLYLLANAHLDPCWQWNKEEGIGAAISTFKATADLLEEDETLVFNHNESVLYEWVERYAPALFARIRALVAAGRWHIAGGWYLQPDCNMPSGESIVRQIMVGRNYFSEKFGVEPDVAVNYDSFGHSDGLVQILADAGYRGYVCMRPQDNPEHHDVVWRGFCNAQVLLHRAVEGYNTLLGQVGKRYEVFVRQMEEKDADLMLWGVGNHGGGPSRRDLAWLNARAEEETKFTVVHAAPEQYFDALEEGANAAGGELPVLRPNGLNYLMQGCYTSQIRIKQLHCRLENELFCAERMNAHAVAAGGVDCTERLREAQEDLLFCEFHDILPGSSIKDVEERAIAQLDHGLHVVSEVRTRQFFFLAGGQRPAAEGEFPILVYNPHPYEWETDVEVELMLADQNWSETEHYEPVVTTADGKALSCQILKEASNIPLDWRKKLVVRVRLRPMTMERLCCRFELRPVRAEARRQEFSLRTDRLEFALDPATGLVERYRVDGQDYLLPGSGELVVVESCCDPWGFHYDDYRDVTGRFRLADEAEARALCVEPEAAPIRVIEDGALQRTFEVLTVCGHSSAVLRYTIAKHDTAVRLDIRLCNAEKDRKIKLKLATAVPGMNYFGKTMFGVNALDKGREVVAQQWVLADNGDKALSAINFGTYGSHAEGDDVYLTLLHSAAYTAHPIEDRKILPADRCFERMDQGERNFAFVLKGSAAEERRAAVGREEVLAQQPPMALNFFPTGEGTSLTEFVTLDNPRVLLSCLKRAERGEGTVLRLFNPTPKRQAFRLRAKALGVDLADELAPSQFRTYLAENGRLREVNCIEREKITHTEQRKV